MKEKHRKGRAARSGKVTSLMVVPHNSDQVLTWRVSNIRLKIVSLLALLIITAASLSAYLTIVVHENKQLKTQQQELSALLIEHQKSIEDNIAQIAQAEDLDTLTKEKIDEFSYLLQNLTTNYIDKEMKTLTVSRSSVTNTTSTAFIGKISELRALISFLEDNEKQGDQVFSVLTEKKEELQNYLDHLPTFWPTNGSIGSEFGNRFHPIYKKFMDHTGVDIGGSKGNSIYAAASGKVVFAGKSGGYGYYVDIDHGNGLVTRYAHCKKLLVKKGQTVMIGEKIAQVGDTGTSTGPHLHFEVRIKDNAVDPTLFIGTKP
ncbi:MAG: peptidoglycan DD-metalloendopeptidase family protein [Ruminiclostridium sp.]|nr:peptidoglycan DD-metalloendopeptidase family protein [Ruminiclostridium sp.]